jgi:hypothetical protein
LDVIGVYELLYVSVHEAIEGGVDGGTAACMYMGMYRRHVERLAVVLRRCLEDVDVRIRMFDVDTIFQIGG